MNKFLLLSIVAMCAVPATAQQFKGQWKGYFSDNSTTFQGWVGDRCEYVLEIETSGAKVTGYSYTYFTQGGKRYYTICKLTGHINKAKKYIEVRETERTKTNIPMTMRNCFQVHKLYYKKGDGSERISGEWIPAPEQNGDCGYGYTVLERRSLHTMVPGYNRSAAPESIAKKPEASKPVAKSTIKKPSAVVRTTPAKPHEPQKSTEKPPLAVNKELKVTVEGRAEQRNKPEMTVPATTFRNRDLAVLKTIRVDNPVISVNVYDNAEVDGDSISLYYNGKLILKNKRLCEKGHLMELTVDTDKLSNELIMHAENLGTIPPNTALMVIRDGQKRYEVRISSDLKKSGVIRFVYGGDHASTVD